MTTGTGEWWYAEGSEQRGPVDADAIRAMVSDGRLDRESLVWRAGMSGWTPAGVVPELGLRPKLPTAGSHPSRPDSGGSSREPQDDVFATTPADDETYGLPTGSTVSQREGYRGGPEGHTYARTPGSMGMSVPSNMLLAILATVLCCLPLGIVAIVKASQVKAIAESGDIARAQSLANDAKKWALWSIAIGLLAQILYFTIVGGSALFGLMNGVDDF